MRLERAKWLLTETDISVTRIVDLVGYNDNSYFTRFFRKKTGLTPNEYRRRRDA